MQGQVDQLAAAILDQARRLAEQYQLQAQSNRERILREAREKLKLREEREVLIAKSRADRTYRRKVQSQELRLQARLDKLRWSLVNGSIERLRERLRELVNDETRYLEVLRGYLQAGLGEFPEQPLAVHVNVTDQARLKSDWAGFCGEAADRLTLAEETIGCVGGLVLTTEDGRIRVDQTFEGRLRRLELELAEVVQANLLPAAVATEEVAAVV